MWTKPEHVTLGPVRTYGQYCPIARASEILAERWTPIVMRNIINGETTYTGIAEGAPGIPRTLLTNRLRQLERAGLVERTPHPRGRGSLYSPTEAGRGLHDVMVAMGTWAEQHLELRPEHCEPGSVLHAWCRSYLAHEHLPGHRVVARFDFLDQPKKADTFWFIFDGDDSEICRTHPGLEEDLVVTAESQALAEWHLGRTEWADAIRDGRIDVVGPLRLKRDLPKWNRRSAWARMGITPAHSA